MAALDPEALQRCFAASVAALTGTPEGVVAIDGKTVRRSHVKTKSGKAAIHRVPAFAARQRIVLGQIKVTEKFNEVTAIAEIVGPACAGGAVVTIDAMGCQRDIAQKIIDRRADYRLALRGNQGSLREDVDVFVAEQQSNNFKDRTVSRREDVDGHHGRIETRVVTVVQDVKWLNERHNGPGLQSLVIVDSTHEIAQKSRRKRAST